MTEKSGRFVRTSPDDQQQKSLEAAIATKVFNLVHYLFDPLWIRVFISSH